jgi:hypothetical protein
MAGWNGRARSHRQESRWAVATLCLILTAGACDSNMPTSAPSSAPSPTSAVVSSVEVTPAAVMLTLAGESKPLTAVGRGADGTAVAGTATWASDDPAVARVDASGTVTAVAAVGSTTVTATVNGVSSLPTIVTITTPVDGAVLLTDSQIVSGPIAVDPAGEPAADAPYEVVLEGVTELSPGDIVVNTESKPVGGRVVSTTPEGDAVRVRLVVVPPGELFTAVDFKDTVDLGTGPYEVPADLAEAYDVAQTGTELTFTPRAATGAVPGPQIGSAALASWIDPGAGQAARQGGVAQGTRALPPFTDCTRTPSAESLPLPLKLSAAPAFTFSTTGTVTRQVTAAGTEIAVAAEPKITFETGLEVQAAFEAKVECKRTLVVRKFRVPGWAGLFFGGDVEFGAGFEIAGKVVVLSAKVGAKAELKPTIQATLSCPAGGECALSGSATAEPKLEPTFETPDLNQLRFEPSVKLFAFVTLEAGNADVDQLQFEAIEAKAGFELAASLTFEGLQIDNRDADAGRSKYKLAFKAEVGPGIKLGEFLGSLGLSAVTLLKLEFEVPLGTSPAGSMTADRPRYLPGDTATVTVTLDQASTIFPSSIGLYNVDSIAIVRRDGLSTQTLAEVDATEGRTTYDIAFNVPALVDADDLYAFVVTRIPLPVKLELGEGSFACAEGASLAIDSIDDDPDKIYLVYDGGSECRLVAEIGDNHFPGDGSDVVLSLDTDPRELEWDGEPTDDDSDGTSWQAVSGYAQNIASGTHTFRSRHVATGSVYEITITVRVESLGGGNTRMTVSDVKIRAVN